MKILAVRRFRPSLAALLGVAIVALAGGCHLGGNTPVAAGVPSVAKPIPAAVMQPLDIRKLRPNEAGVIPILEYHDIMKTMTVHGYQYPAALFRRDIDFLYSHGYRPISLSDYAQGRIDCPAGKTPVIITFDDALRGQFNYLPDGTIDPDCAVGILDAFHAAHPDWALKGTFFVLTNGSGHLPPPFYQKDTAEKKMQYLVAEGYEIGNHTVNHKAGMNHWDDAHVQAEFAGAVANIHKFLPDYNVNTLALPFGIFPQNKKLLVSGQSGGVSYSNICAMAAGANPAPSPMDKGYRPYHIPRIIPGQEHFALQFWFNYLQVHKGARFISDGDPATYTVAAGDKSKIDTARIKSGGYFLRVYSGNRLATIVGPPKAAAVLPKA